MPQTDATSLPVPDLPQTFAFGGDAVRYGTIGDGDPLVLLHGTPFSSVVWRRIAPYLARRRRVFYYDLLGYGRSTKRDGQDVSLGIQNRVFCALLDHWGLERPDIVAQDFGGTTALRTHLLDGRDYRSLTLIDPVAFSPTGSAMVQIARANERVFADLPAYIHAAVLRAYIGDAVHRKLSDAEMALYTAPWLGDIGQAAFYRQIAQMDDRFLHEIETRFGEVRCPTTVLWGEQDAWIPHAQGKALAGRIPGADFRLIPNASHLVQEDAPEAIVVAAFDRLAATT